MFILIDIWKYLHLNQNSLNFKTILLNNNESLVQKANHKQLNSSDFSFML